MEKEELWGTNWQPGDGKAPPEANFSFAADNQLPQRFLNLNRKQRTTYDADFELAVPSLMSSTTSNPPSSASGAVIGELIGRLGSIHNSGKISPSCGRRIVANTALYTTALNSPPKPTLSVAEHRKQGLRAPAMPPNWMPGSRRGSFSPDVGFADGTAALASFGELGLPQTGNAARLSSSNASIAPRMEMGMSSKFGGYLTSGESEIGHKRLESSLCVGNAGKRKAGAKRKAKEAAFSYSATSHPTGMMGEDSSDAKRCKIKAKMEQNSEQEQGKNGADKSTEPSKDYVHVRARRGQATDSHSLAERVRREKISKRMKFLQDLVPGCSKVTGKAVMLDEIINYVQSLQWQVEFLSMKLATLKPQLGPNMGNLAPEDVHRAYGTMLRTAYPAEIMSKELSYAHQSQTTTGQTQDQVESSVHQSQNMHLAPIDGYEDLTSQLGNFWGDELQSVAQMGFDQYQDTQHSPPKFSMVSWNNEGSIA